MNMIAAATALRRTRALARFPDPHGHRFPVRPHRPQAGDADPAEEARFAGQMDDFSDRAHTDAANEQHYELPADFFGLALGPRPQIFLLPLRRRRDDARTGRSEGAGGDRRPRRPERWPAHPRARLRLGFAVALHGASAIPHSSHHRGVQLPFAARTHHGRGADARTVATCASSPRHERLRRPTGSSTASCPSRCSSTCRTGAPCWTACASWIAPDGRLFLHVFSHRTQPYRFDVADEADWIAQYFFTGGVMPSHDLIRHFPDLFEVEEDWRWSGEHYRRTAMTGWRTSTRNIDEVSRLMQDVYGARPPLWTRRWRLFFLATAGLFGHDGAMNGASATTG